MKNCEWRKVKKHIFSFFPESGILPYYIMNKIADALETVTSYFFLNDSWMDTGKPEDNEKKIDSVN